MRELSFVKKTIDRRPFHVVILILNTFAEQICKPPPGKLTFVLILRSLLLKKSRNTASCVCFLATLGLTPCFAQHEHSLTISGTQLQLPGSVNGAVSPQSIPDSIAYRMFFKILLLPDNPSDEQLDRQKAIVRTAELNETDLSDMRVVIQQFGVAVESHNRAVMAAGQSPAGIDESTAKVFGQQLEQIVSDTIGKLRTRLSPDGMQRLHDLVISEKRNMTIVTLPVMSDVKVRN